MQKYPWHINLAEHYKAVIKGNSMPHALLLRERDGFYDESLVSFISGLILCDENSNEDNCKHCKLANDNTHPNIIYLNGQDKLSINDIRELEQLVWKTPTFDKARVVIIRCLDLISVAAQNALLKTLEEPPKNTFFILTVINKSDILKTIISRVSYQKHPKVEEQDVLHWLQLKITEQGVEKGVLEIAKIAKLVNINPQLSLELMSSNDMIETINNDKKEFAMFIRNRIGAVEFADKIEKDNISKYIKRYNDYIDVIIKTIFRENKNKIEIDNWNGVTLKRLYLLRDVFNKMLILDKGNLNMAIQLKSELLDWQSHKD